MSEMKKQSTVEICARLAEPVEAALGVFMWDVTFEKEGSSWFLRYYIDKDGGVDINDCENFSRRIDVILDQADPIEQSYCLEVSSPGLERKLTKQSHFERYLGERVVVKLFRVVPELNAKQLTGILKSYNKGDITIHTEDGGDLLIHKNDISYVKLFIDFTGGNDQ